MDTIGVPCVYDKNAWRFAAQLGWNAMPSNPPSEFALTVSETRVLAVGFPVLGKTRTRAVPAEPLPFSSTNQRVSSPGA
jgi:hypothetical protein